MKKAAFSLHIQLPPAQAANHPKWVVDQPHQENPALCRHWRLQEFLRSPKGGLRRLSPSGVSFAQYGWPGAPHRQGVQLEPLGRTLNSLERRSHCRQLCDTEDFSAAYDRRTGRSVDPWRGHQSHKSSKEWQGCRCRWHSPRDLKARGEALHSKLHELFVCCWEQEKLPQDLRDAVIITLYKNKTEKSDSSNHRGITLLSITGKILARVLLNRLIPAVAYTNVCSVTELT